MEKEATVIAKTLILKRGEGASSIRLTIHRRSGESLPKEV